MRLHEDNLVLVGLGLMIYTCMMDKIAMNNFVGPTIYKRDSNSIICDRDYVSRLYRLDLSPSLTLNTLNKESLLSRLSELIIDGDIMELLRKFMNLPILDSGGRDNTEKWNCQIPPSGFITDILLTFALIEFDEEFQRVFPQSEYSRYVHEVLVSFPTFGGKDGILFEQEIYSLFDKHNLCGKMISIGPGDPPLPCHTGEVSISLDGDIHVTEL